MIEISQYSKEIALALLGEENKRLSSAYELRYGNKGSLSVDLNKGTWFDHEADEGGGMISFIKKYHGEDVSQFLRSMGIEDLQPVSVTPQPEKPQRVTAMTRCATWRRKPSWSHAIQRRSVSCVFQARSYDRSADWMMAHGK